MRDMLGDEEERRVGYVAITRARRELYLTCSARRQGLSRRPSRFIGEALAPPPAMAA